MTTLSTPDFQREAIAAPSLRRSVAAMVRRRVPAEDAEDVAQTILCDALAAPGMPSEPEELRRFVAGIARHKVADFHRRARRSDMGEIDELVAPSAPMEARTLLARIASSVASSTRERETLEWLVREHAGEQLRAIAEDAGVPAPAVRQRVSRLRRMLRAQWAHALVLLVVAGAAGAAAERARERTAIVADPAGDGIGEATFAAQGHWSVERVNLEDPSAVPLERRVVDIHVRGHQLTIEGPLVSVKRTVVAATSHKDGAVTIELQDEAGRAERVSVRVEGEVMQLTVHDGRLRGTATLIRR